jgi:hypothetical protein
MIHVLEIYSCYDKKIRVEKNECMALKSADMGYANGIRVEKIATKSLLNLEILLECAWLDIIVIVK